MAAPCGAGGRAVNMRAGRNGQAMETVRTVEALRGQVLAWRQAGARVALVPTMGALHAGHLSLLETARGHADRLIASIFVNPKQFGPNEDFDRYPRAADADAALLSDAGCDLLFLPPVDAVYPAGFSTHVAVAGLGDDFCGAARPGHFDGVATVVAKLLIMAGPDVAVFGEKDWQQLAIIRRMATDLNLPVAIIGSPTVRDADGLALSSRNAFLSAGDRAAAAALPAAMRAAIARIEGGAGVTAVLAEAEQQLLAAGFSSVDYIALADAASLARLDQVDRPARLLAAARIGGTRLIDNMAVEPRP